uniref:Putative ixodes 8-cys protein n=1 Tax=Ixodes ricinus TaxID=34613 RepID=A0A0K8RBS3_IXORI
MKVVCIILLFVIAAESGSTGKEPVVKPSNGKNSSNRIQFKYPPYIHDHMDFALSLLRICGQGGYTPTINDLKVDFKNCTFLCKRNSGDVTLDLPKETPCGPRNQTCQKKEDCVEYIPGC